VYAALSVGAVVAACAEAPAPTDILAFGESRSAPVEDPEGARCDDAVGVRVCFREREGRAAQPELTPLAPAPGPVPADAQWRCEGAGDERVCRLERRRPFRCEAGTCVQSFPRVPDDGEWECADVDGLVVCRTRSAAAGVVAGLAAVGWICGEGEDRVCVDLAPDQPAKRTGDCRFRYEATMDRLCTYGPKEPRLFGACAAGGVCPRGATCVAAVCVPRFRPRPDCWTDRDCEEGRRCVLATCIEPSPGPSGGP
jgi:hypothetical protein